MTMSVKTTNAPRNSTSRNLSYRYTHMLHKLAYAALFVTVKVWKQPKCLSLGKRSNKLWYMHSMEHDAVIKMSEVSVEMLIRSFKIH